MARKKEYINICGNDYLIRKSKFCVNWSPVHVSDGMSGKMSGIPSISTSCLENPICQRRMQDGNSICAHCFAGATLERYKAAGVAAASNYYLLNSTVLPLDLLPVFGNVAIVRIESFGDVASVTQAINYINIALVNPSVTFAWWSKNISIIKKAIDTWCDGIKPKNIILVESSEKLNTVKEKSPVADKVFTVFDDAHIADDAVNINCGARCCATCRRCYSKDTETIVNERLK